MKGSSDDDDDDDAAAEDGDEEEGSGTGYYEDEMRAKVLEALRTVRMIKRKLTGHRCFGHNSQLVSGSLPEATAVMPGGDPKAGS